MDAGARKDFLRGGGAGAEGHVVAELVGLFIEHAPPKITAIREAIAGGDAEAAKRAAHSLKGSSANVGARGMQQVCEQIEQAAAGGVLSQAPALLAQLEEESVVVAAALRAEVGA